MSDPSKTLPVAPAPPETVIPPAIPLPQGACDAHVHIVADDFPLWDARVEDPAPGTLEQWLDRLGGHLDRLGFDRVVLVHSIFYGSENALTLAALNRLGPARARGIGLLCDGATESEIATLRQGHCMGVRLNYVHGGVLSWDGARAMAPLLAAQGMHIQMLMNADRHMADLAGDLAAVPVPVVFDHIGWPDVSAGPDEPGFAQLCRALADGRAWVKLSGLYRVSDRPYDATDELVAALVTANPERCLWGSDWPHIMLADAGMPDAGELLNRLLSVVSDDDTRQRIFCDNPAALYGF